MAVSKADTLEQDRDTQEDRAILSETLRSKIRSELLLPVSDALRTTKKDEAPDVQTTFAIVNLRDTVSRLEACLERDDERNSNRN